jgi:hypothetical protein
MRRATLGLTGGAIVAALTFAGASHAANLNLNDTTPGEVTIAWSGFEFLGKVYDGPASPSGSVTLAGENSEFSGSWIASTPSSSLGGIIYIVDPGQPDVVRARIEAIWTAGPDPTPVLNVMVFSSPFGADLGALPVEFAGLGVPMPDGDISIEGLFRDPFTAAPVSPPSPLTIQYGGDIVPECPEPALLTQAPTQINGSFSDLAMSGPSIESAESVTFAQTVTIQSLRWWGIYFSAGTPLADSLRLRVYEDVGGLPADTAYTEFPLAPVRVGNGTVNSGVPEFAYAASLPASLTLAAGRTYWLALVNDTSNDGDDQWAWTSGAAANPDRAVRQNGGGAWSLISQFSLALELCGEVITTDCPTDFDADGMTTGADLAVLLASWGPCDPPLLLAPAEPSERLDTLSNPSDDWSTDTRRRR